VFPSLYLGKCCIAQKERNEIWPCSLCNCFIFLQAFRAHSSFGHILNYFLFNVNYCAAASLIFCFMPLFIPFIFPIRFHYFYCYSPFLHYNFIFCLYIYIYSFLVNFHKCFIFPSLESSFPVFHL
jgi:hypothetical protein